MAANKGFTWMKFFIVLVPVWLLVSGCIGLWLHFHIEKKEREEQRHAYRRAINEESLLDDFVKIADGIGSRNLTQMNGAASLGRMSSMIEGSLGVSNMGYEVKKIPGIIIDDVSLPIFTVDVLRRETKQEIWLVVPYDSPADSPRGAASASSLSLSFAVAQALVGQSLESNVRFLYVPGAFASEDLRMDLVGKCQRLIQLGDRAKQVLVLGSMLHAGALSAVGQDATQPLFVQKNIPIAMVSAAEYGMQNDVRFSQLLLEKGVPTSEIFARSDHMNDPKIEDSMTPPAKLIAAQAEQVLALIKSLAQAKAP
jgi:hypothetical protein